MLLLAAAAATVWLVWPTRHGGVVTRRALWGLAGTLALTALFIIGIVSALGSTSEDVGSLTLSKTVEPSLGLFGLIGGVAAHIVGIVLAGP